VIRFKAGYVYLDPNEIERLRAQLARPPALSGSELLRAALAGEYAGCADRSRRGRTTPAATAAGSR
jgi:hypothetical protein